MSLEQDIQSVAEAHKPCLVVAAQITGVDEASVLSAIRIGYGLEGRPEHEVVHCLAGVLRGYTEVVNKTAQRLGVPFNRLQTLISDHMNSLSEKID